jgi:hypothetical protein
MSSGTKTVQRIPFPFAVAILVGILLITGLFFGKWNFTTWVIFITWAEYFVFGATPGVGKNMLPSLAFGATTAAVWMLNWVIFESLFKTNFSSTPATWLILTATNFIWVAGLCYAIQKIKLFQAFGLACFNGLTLFLALYFTTLGGAKNSIPQVGPLDNPYWVIFLTWIWDILMCWAGWLAGWVNMLLTFPKEVKA